LADEGSILWTFDPITLTASDTQEVHLGEKNTITADEVFLTVKSLMAALKYDLKCLKS